MLRRPPRSTRTDTLFPYTTLFRAGVIPASYILNTPNRVGSIGAFSAAESDRPSTIRVSAGSMMPSSHSRAVAQWGYPWLSYCSRRSAARRVGKGCVSPGGSRWSPDTSKKREQLKTHSESDDDGGREQ